MNTVPAPAVAWTTPFLGHNTAMVAILWNHSGKLSQYIVRIVLIVRTVIHSVQTAGPGANRAVFKGRRQAPTHVPDSVRRCLEAFRRGCAHSLKPPLAPVTSSTVGRAVPGRGLRGPTGAACASQKGSWAPPNSHAQFLQTAGDRGRATLPFAKKKVTMPNGDPRAGLKSGGRESILFHIFMRI